MKGRSIPFLGAEEVAAATPMPALIRALSHAFATGDTVAPTRLMAPMAGSTLLVMPAWNSAAQLGVKIVTVDARRRPSVSSTYVLLDAASGEPTALIDGATLTRRRTAAASALAAQHLARSDSHCLFVLGTGALSGPLVQAYAAVFDLERVLIWGRSTGSASAAAARVRAAGYPAETVAQISEGLEAADIVSAATLASAPLILGDRLRPGTHVDLVGAFRPDMCEADPVTFARSRVFVDTRDGVASEAGDLIQAIAAGSFALNDIEADLAELCSGKHPGRTSDSASVTVFKSVGCAIEDLVAATMVVEANGP